MTCSVFWTLSRSSAPIIWAKAWAGRTGTMLGIQHPDRLNRLMLSASSCGPPSGAYRQMFDEQLAVAQSEGMEALLEFKVRRDELPESLREGPLAGEYKERFLKNTPRDVRRYRKRAVHDAGFKR